MKAHLIAFILVFNFNDRQFYVTSLSNDQFMAMYLLIAFYYFAKSHLVKAVFWFTMAVSVNAGALIIFPTLLTVILYNNGLIRMLVSALFTVGF